MREKNPANEIRWKTDDGEMPKWVKGLFIVTCLVIAVALVMGLLTPKPASPRAASTKSRAMADLTTLDGAFLKFALDCGRLPTEDEGLGALLKAPTHTPHWHGPYLTKLLSDPWGRPYLYRLPYAKQGRFLVESFGADGKPGGMGEDADIRQTGFFRPSSAK